MSKIRSILYLHDKSDNEDTMDEQRKHAILFAATILAARKLAEIGDKPCPAREACMEDAIRSAERILQKIDERWQPSEAGSSSSASIRGRREPLWV